ncbi:MAG: hypothetical protein ACYCO0_02110 [Candidatus Micrarchaeaceae archaeon]
MIGIGYGFINSQLYMAIGYLLAIYGVITLGSAKGDIYYKEIDKIDNDLTSVGIFQESLDLQEAIADYQIKLGIAVSLFAFGLALIINPNFEVFGIGFSIIMAITLIGLYLGYKRSKRKIRSSIGDQQIGLAGRISKRYLEKIKEEG